MLAKKISNFHCPPLSTDILPLSRRRLSCDRPSRSLSSFCHWIWRCWWWWCPSIALERSLPCWSSVFDGWPSSASRTCAGPGREWWLRSLNWKSSWKRCSWFRWLPAFSLGCNRSWWCDSPYRTLYRWTRHCPSQMASRSAPNSSSIYRRCWAHQPVCLHRRRCSRTIESEDSFGTGHWGSKASARCQWFFRRGYDRICIWTVFGWWGLLAAGMDLRKV